MTRGELAALVSRIAKLGSALETISEMHLPDQPAALNMPEIDYAMRHIREMRWTAKRALEEDDEWSVAGQSKDSGPYPGCHHPEKCNLTGRCLRDPVCYN